MSKFGAKKKAVEVESTTAAKPKKDGLTVNLDGDKPRIVKNGEEATKASRKDAQEKANKSVGKEKAAKAAPAKAAKAPKEKAERASKEADTRKITIAADYKKSNPKREGTASYDRFELYRTSKTVADFISAGGTTGDIRNDEAKGYITLA